MSTRAKILQIIFSPVLWVLYFISGLIPKSDAIEVYGSPGNRFSDNAKYSYLTLRSNDQSKKYWITSNKPLIKILRAHGLLAENRWSIKGIIVCCRAAKYHFSSYASDINFWTSKNSIHINYWHGVPFKKIEHDIHTGPLKVRFNPQTKKEKIVSMLWFFTSPAPRKRPSILYSPHPSFEKYFISAFRIKKDRIKVKRYPRVDYLISNDGFHKLCNEALPSTLINFMEGKLAVLYVPTFRDSNKNNWIKKNILPHSLKIQDAIQEKNIALIVKPHPNEIIESGLITQNIYILNSSIDTYTLMKSVNQIITDYSSISVDAAQAGKRVYLLWPDFNEYKSKSRELYFDLEKFYNKKHYSSIDEMLDDLRNGVISTRDVSVEINNLNK